MSLRRKVGRREEYTEISMGPNNQDRAVAAAEEEEEREIKKFSNMRRKPTIVRYSVSKKQGAYFF